MTYAVNYVEGSEHIIGPMPRNLSVTRKGVHIFLILSKYQDMIPWDAIQRADIRHYTIDDKTSAGGALVGGLLLGPVGAIAGGLSGGKRTGTDLNICYLTPSNEKKVLVINVNYAGTADRIKRKIDSQLKKRFGTSERATLDSFTPKHDSVVIDKIASLEKLSALRKDGTLTEAEFQEQKTSILNYQATSTKNRLEG